MAALISFLIAIAAGVAAHYICKWLDGKEKVASLKNPEAHLRVLILTRIPSYMERLAGRFRGGIIGLSFE